MTERQERQRMLRIAQERLQGWHLGILQASPIPIQDSLPKKFPVNTPDNFPRQKDAIQFQMQSDTLPLPSPSQRYLSTTESNLRFDSVQLSKQGSLSRVLMEKKVVNEPNFPRLVDLLRIGPGINKHRLKSRQPVSSGRCKAKVDINLVPDCPDLSQHKYTSLSRQIGCLDTTNGNSTPRASLRPLNFEERMHNNITHMRQSVSGASTHRASAHHARPSVSGASTHRLNASSESADGWPPLHFSGVGSPPLPQDPALHGFSLSPNMGQSLCQEKGLSPFNFLPSKEKMDVNNGCEDSSHKANITSEKYYPRFLLESTMCSALKEKAELQNTNSLYLLKTRHHMDIAQMLSNAHLISIRQMQYVRSMEEPSDRKVNHDILKPKTSRPQTTCKITNDTFDIARIPESATKI